MSDPYGGQPQVPQYPQPYPQYPQHPQYPQQPQYGWGPVPAAPPSAPPPEPPARRRRVHPAVIVVAAVIAAAVVVGVLVTVLTDRETVDAPGTGGRRLAIPAQLTGYSPVPGVNTDDLKASLGDDIAEKGDDPEDVVRHAAVGVFQQRSTGARVVFLGIALRDIPSFRGQVRADGVEATLKFFVGGASKELSGERRTTAFPPGDLGGFLRCASGELDGDAASVCGWGDESAFALTIITGTVSLQSAAGTTRTLREAIERR